MTNRLIRAGMISFSLLSSASLQAGELPPSEQVYSTTVTPPQAVEDMRTVQDRAWKDPVQHAYSYGALTLFDGRHLPDPSEGEIDLGENVFPYIFFDDIDRALLRGFPSVNSGSIFPPDCTMDAGPAHIVAGTNGGFGVYNKLNGTQFFGSSYATFFSQIQPAGTFTSDPRILYDRDSGRWFNMILAIRGADDYSWYMIAVSQTSDPTGVWKKYLLDSTLNGSTPTGDWSDYPMMGIDKDALYISANMFPRASGGTSVKLRVIPKAQLVAFSNSISYSDIANITGPAGQGVFSVHPAATIGNTNPALFMASTDGGTTINIYGVTNALTTPVLTKKSLTVPSYGFPPAAGQTGGGVTLDSLDGRVQATPLWRNGSLWLCNTISGGSVPAVRWYQVNTNNWPATVSLVQSGTVSQAGASLFNPSIAVNGAGDASLSFTRSSSTSGTAIYFSARKAADALNTMSTPSPIRTSSGNYNPGIGSPSRWGDYSATVVDPVDDTSFWAYNEVPAGATSWTTWVQNYDLTGNQQLSVDASGVGPIAITVTPGDLGGESSGTTPFSRNYNSGTVVTLTAPSSVGTSVFGEWIVNDSSAGSSLTTSTTVSGFTTAVAKYVPTNAVTINSSPFAGIPITIGTADAFGNASGTTPFTRNYLTATNVTLTAPVVFNGARFKNWLVNGSPQDSNPLAVGIFSIITYTADYGCRGDVSGDNVVDTFDLSLLLAYYGTPAAPGSNGDLNGDGFVDTSDLILLLARFGQACP